MVSKEEEEIRKLLLERLHDPEWELLKARLSDFLNTESGKPETIIAVRMVQK